MNTPLVFRNFSMQLQIKSQNSSNITASIQFNSAVTQQPCISEDVANITYSHYRKDFVFPGYIIRVITKLPNSEQSYKGKVKTHKYINRQNRIIIY